ncbi:glutaredoxin 2 [Sodalis sp. RH24]|uniref:glutaredoxin 2 n=1 Tax=unclassified Sodalis (in: enterobacteria) TaxID=2636512 RepID=UPI0039B41FD0
MKLYIYEHCPFCVKARMIFGLKNIPISLQVLMNDDEATPIGMVGKKVAPILQKEDGGYMPESMDIVHYIDTHYGSPLVTGPVNPAIGKWLEANHPAAYPLVLPRNVNGKFAEFATPEARQYFIRKKEAASGSFEELLAHTPGLVKKVSQQLRELEPLIQQSNACNGELSDDDFHLFARLRSLTIVAGLEWPTRVAEYRDNMAKQTQVNLLTSVAQ